MPVTMREQLEEAFDDDNNDETEGQEAEAGGSTEDAAEPLGDAGETDNAPEEGSEEGAGDSGEGAADAGDANDADKKEAAADKVGASKEQDTGESNVKAPASWKPGAREHWAKVPVEAQREIARREKHMDNMIRDSADSRKHQNDFNELVRPFEGMIAAQNSTPFQAVGNLMRTAAGLTMGSPQQKAQVVQNIMNQYGVDIQTLDQVLAGGMAQQQNQIGQPQLDPNISHAIQQHMAPVNQFMGQMNQQRQTYEQGQQHAMNSDIHTFAQDPKNEFFADVRENMADLMDMAANRNESMTMEQAYEKACRMDDSINNILGGRTAASNAADNKGNIARKRHAASSISGGAAANAGQPAASTLRGAIVDAWDDRS